MEVEVSARLRVHILPGLTDRLGCDGCLINGSFYLLNRPNWSNNYTASLWSFDMEREELQAVALPEEVLKAEIKRNAAMEEADGFRRYVETKKLMLNMGGKLALVWYDGEKMETLVMVSKIKQRWEKKESLILEDMGGWWRAPLAYFSADVALVGGLPYCHQLQW